MVVGSWQTGRVVQNLLISQDGAQSEKKRKYQVNSRCVDVKALLVSEENGQTGWRLQKGIGRGLYLYFQSSQQKTTTSVIAVSYTQETRATNQTGRSDDSQIQQHSDVNSKVKVSIIKGWLHPVLNQWLWLLVALSWCGGQFPGKPWHL